MTPLTTLLGLHLKDDAVLAAMREHGIGEVIYDFDRLLEGGADRYWAPAPAAGFALGFDAGQVLATVFCYAVPLEGFTPIAPALAGVPFHPSAEAAMAAARAAGEQTANGHAELPLLGLRSDWVRIEGTERWAHYEYRDGRLALVTLSLPPA